MARALAAPQHASRGGGGGEDARLLVVERSRPTSLPSATAHDTRALATDDEEDASFAALLLASAAPPHAAAAAAMSAARPAPPPLPPAAATVAFFSPARTSATLGDSRIVVLLPPTDPPSWSAVRAHFRGFGFAVWTREEPASAESPRHAVIAYKRALSAEQALRAASHVVEGVALRVALEADAPAQLLQPATSPLPPQPLVAAPALSLVTAVPAPPSTLRAAASQAAAAAAATAAAAAAATAAAQPAAAATAAAVSASSAPAVPAVPPVARSAARAALLRAESDLENLELNGDALLSPAARAALDSLFAAHGSATAVHALLEGATIAEARGRGLLSPASGLPLSVRLLRLSGYLRRKQLPADAVGAESSGGDALLRLLAVPRLADLASAVGGDDDSGGSGGGDAEQLSRAMKLECHERLLRVWQRVAPRATRRRGGAGKAAAAAAAHPARAGATERLDALLQRHALALSDDSGASGTETEADGAASRGAGGGDSGSEDGAARVGIPDVGSGSESEADARFSSPKRVVTGAAHRVQPPAAATSDELFRRLTAISGAKRTQLLDQRLR